MIEGINMYMPLPLCSFMHEKKERELTMNKKENWEFKFSATSFLSRILWVPALFYCAMDDFYANFPL